MSEQKHIPTWAGFIIIGIGALIVLGLCIQVQQIWPNSFGGKQVIEHRITID